MNEETLVKLFHLKNQMKLLESMIANLSCGDVTDDKEKEREHIDMMWALSMATIEYVNTIEQEIEK